ncbi:MAG: hypothetical protein ACXAB7_03635 [Candidatus Kariarchaeaceae archaeon]|jgi:predicted transcriptional regulator
MKHSQSIILLLLLPFLIVEPLDAQLDEPRVLILYSQFPEKANIENAIFTHMPSSTVVSTIMSNLNVTDLTEYDMLIFLSSENFTLSDQNRADLWNFASTSKKSTIILTPYLENFNTSLLDTFGIASFNQTYPTTVNPADWVIAPNETLGGNATLFTNTSYTGSFGVFDPKPSSNVMVNVTFSFSADLDIQQLMLPLPAVINGSTSDSQIITGSLAPISSAVGGLNLHQVPYDFDTLITELMIKVVQQHVSLNQVVTTIPSVSSSTSSASRSTTASSATTPATEDDPGSFDVPLDLTDLIWILIIGVLLLLVFFARRILRILHWLEEKSWGLIIGVFGAFYNVHDRILDQNQVLLNQSRSNIMLYLEHMSHYGAHLREIKSTLKMGTGILLWHLQVLEEFGWVNQHQIGRYKIFIAYDYSVDFNPEQKKLELELRSKYTKVIIETLIAVEESVTLTLTEFSQKVSADRKIIRKHLDVLDHADAIEVQKEGVMTTIFIVDKELIENLLGGIQLRESFSTDPTVSVESTN